METKIYKKIIGTTLLSLSLLSLAACQKSRTRSSKPKAQPLERVYQKDNRSQYPPGQQPPQIPREEREPPRGNTPLPERPDMGERKSDQTDGPVVEQPRVQPKPSMDGVRTTVIPHTKTISANSVTPKNKASLGCKTPACKTEDKVAPLSLIHI